MNYSNPFHRLLLQMSEDAGWVLQLVHTTRGVRLAELEPELLAANISRADRHLRDLEKLGLVVFEAGLWKTTWTGAGVSNWRTQLRFADDDQAVPEPREGENGHQPGPECNEYRAALFAPGYCWCRRARRHHASEIVKAAEKLLQ